MAKAESGRIFSCITSGLTIETIRNARQRTEQEVQGFKDILADKNTCVPKREIENGLRISEEVQTEYSRHTDEKIFIQLQDMFDYLQQRERESDNYMEIIPTILKDYPDTRILIGPLIFDASIVENNGNWPHKLAAKITVFRGLETE